MEERGAPVADYFVVAGLSDNPEPVDDDLCEGLNENEQNLEPITDITVIFPTFENVPKGFTCVEKTPNGYPANLNSGSLRSPEVYLCYRRGKDKPPLVDIGVMYDGKERLLPDAEVIISTPTGRDANVNNTSARTLLTFRRAPRNMACNELVVTDVCVIFQNKGERPPHAFCVIPKNLNKGMVGCDVYLCYKKSMHRPPLLAYKPEVLMRYPLVDRRTCPFPNLAAMFCLPMCATIECWPKDALQPRPVFSTFVLTVADATEKIYGAALTVYEEYPEEKLSQEQRIALGMILPGDDKRVHVNKCICLLSHYPFFDAFRTFLFYLSWMVRNGSHDVPVERYISHLLEEVPFPSPQRPHILMQLSPTQNLLLSHQHDSPLPKSGASFRQMLTNLGPDNCLMVLLLVLTEQKLLIHSLRPDILTAVAEAVSVLIFPFRWQCPYIPLCPLGLCAVLQAPVPFLVGVDSRFFDLYEPPSDVTCIDLDTTTISVSEDRRQYLNIKLLPKKPAKILRQNLEHLKLVLDNMAALSRSAAKNRHEGDIMDIDFQLKRKERLVEMEIQEAFLRFMTGILRGYRSYLLPITKAPTVGATDASSLFDFQAFLRSRDKNYHKFYQHILKTQMFFRFIEERSFVSDSDASLEFFDECTDRMDADDSENVKLVDFNESSQSERTVFVMPPEPIGLPANAKYSYNGIFQLSDDRFGAVKPKPDALNRLLRDNEQSAPGSPIARRTKQEIKSSQKNAKKYSENPHLWAKYLLSTCYSLWFIHLPSYVSIAASKHMALCLAYESLVRLSKMKLPADEVCYRVVMQLCGLHSQPLVAVKVLFEMKRCGITPNAMTYGFYNKAVLEAQWPSNVSNSSQLMWNKLRNVIVGVAQFRAAGRQHHIRNRRQFSQSTDDVDKISTGSGASLDSQQNQINKIAQIHTSPSRSAMNHGTSYQNGKSQSDSESVSVATTAVPTRISSSSDVGYSSMTEQKHPSDTDTEEREPSEETTTSQQNFSKPNTKTAKFWGQMGRSLDQWVRSGVSSLANVASYAADTSYYSPASLMISDYSAGGRQRDYYDDEEDEFDENDTGLRRPFNPARRLNFEDELDDNNGKGTNTLRLLRSVSFGNDTQIMCKLKELKDDMIAEERGKRQLDNSQTQSEPVDKHDGPGENPIPSQDINIIRSGSVESACSLEGKVKNFYEEKEQGSGEKSREITPVDDDYDDPSYQDTLRPDSLKPLCSQSVQIRQENGSKSCSREVTPSSPARTPVTQNDPLGALSDPCSPTMDATVGVRNVKGATKKFVVSAAGITKSIGGSSISDLRMQKDSPKRTCSEGYIGGYMVGPGGVLENHDIRNLPSSSKSSFHRSSTLPNYSTIVGIGGNEAGPDGQNINEKYLNGSGSNTPVVPSLSAISSSLKNPFGRYSPGRLSLRKAGTSFIESTIGGKKAEALMEGFNQFKSAATVTMKNKIEEFKEVVNNNSPAPRNGPFGQDLNNQDLSDCEGVEPAVNEWASVSESYLDKLLTTDPVSTRASFASADIGYGLSHHDTPLSNSTQSLLVVDNSKAGTTSNPSRREHPRPIALEISMTTCSKCHSCNSLLFDEEIMAGWTCEDSNLNTRCPHCMKWAVPFMEVTVTDYRHHSLSQMFPMTSASSIESMHSMLNLSRRPSVMNPPQKSQPNEKENSQVDNISQEVKGKVESVANGNEDEQQKDLTLDPLGVIEELQRSRRNSPDITEPEESSALNQPTAEQVEATAVTAEVNPRVISSTIGNCTLNVGSQPSLPCKKFEGVVGDPILVPYLSPLVLRKELENVLDHEGDTCLVQPKFVDEHPIIYWNLVWFFQRSNLTSHIKGLCLNAKSVLPNKKIARRKEKLPDDNATSPHEDTEYADFTVHPSWEAADHRNVSVRSKWDNSKFHSEYSTPLYLHWLKNKEKDGKLEREETDTEESLAFDNNIVKLMNNVIKATQNGSLSHICPQLLYHYHKQSTGRHFPTYRDVLFLSLVAAGRESVEAYGFGLDKDYRDVYSKFRCNDDFESMDTGDLPPNDTALFCRRYFKELEL